MEDFKNKYPQTIRVITILYNSQIFKLMNHPLFMKKDFIIKLSLKYCKAYTTHS